MPAPCKSMLVAQVLTAAWDASLVLYHTSHGCGVYFEGPIFFFLGWLHATYHQVRDSLSKPIQGTHLLGGKGVLDDSTCFVPAILHFNEPSREQGQRNAQAISTLMIWGLRAHGPGNQRPCALAATCTCHRTSFETSTP